VVRIRLHGMPDDVQATAEALRDVFDVVDESRDYCDRPPSQLVRRYLTTTDKPMETTR
jgi:hypothetical protein